MSFYPPKINEKFQAPNNAGTIENLDAKGTGASFVCGAAVRFYLQIDARNKQILEAKYKTNGCGFAIAAAEILADEISGRKLTELHGLEIWQNDFDASRKHCAEIALDALHNALANFRLSQIEEFQGEKALICTCFGVSEESIETVIAENQIETVEEVGEVCNAGTGCGSCRFLIQEMIDIQESAEKNFFY
jgi:NifU-like protein